MNKNIKVLWSLANICSLKVRDSFLLKVQNRFLVVYLFDKKWKNANFTTNWVCENKNCNASVTTTEDNKITNVAGKKFIDREQILAIDLHEPVDVDELIVQKHVVALKKNRTSWWIEFETALLGPKNWGNKGN